MGAKKVTPEEIVKMHVLFQKYGSYAEVGREIGRSGSTVSKYINLDLPHNVKLAIHNLVNE